MVSMFEEVLVTGLIGAFEQESIPKTSITMGKMTCSLVKEEMVLNNITVNRLIKRTFLVTS